ncbi:hypothetical protein QL285_005029 [Trifolium repens]|nr:hypothetical protein QL285_005029 [Trifolium repens]
MLPVFPLFKPIFPQTVSSWPSQILATVALPPPVRHGYIFPTVVQLSTTTKVLKRSRSRLDYVKVFTISVGIDVTTLIAVVAV